MATNPYTTVAQVKSMLGIGDTDDDAFLDVCLGAASRKIEDLTGDRFWVDSAVTVREFYADDAYCLRVDAGISTTTGLTVYIDEDGDGTFETELTITTDFILKPTNAPDEVPVRPYTEIVLVDNYRWPIHMARPSAQVTAKFGWPAVPDDVALACMLLTKDLFKSKDSPGGSPEFAPLDTSVSRTVKDLLRGYTKVSVG